MQGVLHIKNRRTTHRKMLYMFDWFIIFISALVGALLFGLVPVRQHIFRLDDPEISYPYHPDIISFGNLMMISLGIPFAIISFLSVCVVKNKRDFHHGTMGLCQTIALILVTSAIVKIFLGGLRPHFLMRCAPDPAKIATAPRYGYGGIYYDTSICTNSQWEINDAQSAFPSAHSAMAAGGLNYLSLYLNGKFKVFQHQGHLLVYVLITASSFGSFLVGFTRVVDFHHTFYNVMMGWTMGFLVCISMYRLNYVSLFGSMNHVPVGDTWHEQDEQAVYEELRKIGKATRAKNNTDISHILDEGEDDPGEERRKRKSK
eukprot:Phypoly_transcript_12209.p1 GENE.Phypoly_transcript_12209~~Phypoly_transcript_12209.p1  ORF type:complete len:316 (+),score=37.67 Phypoly_transcript_12209:154-1101(+)